MHNDCKVTSCCGIRPQNIAPLCYYGVRVISALMTFKSKLVLKLKSMTVAGKMSNVCHACHLPIYSQIHSFPLHCLALYHKGLTLQTTFSWPPSQLGDTDRILKGRQMGDFLLLSFKVASLAGQVASLTPTGQPLLCSPNFAWQPPWWFLVQLLPCIPPVLEVAVPSCWCWITSSSHAWLLSSSSTIVTGSSY